jgi:hypothetical protein
MPRVTIEQQDRLSDKERERLERQLYDSAQALERDRQGLAEISVNIETDDAIELVPIGDWHIGSLATDLDQVFEVIDYVLENPNRYVVFIGDLLEGLKSRYVDTNTAMLAGDMTLQFDSLFRKIESLLNSDRVLGNIGGFWGHENWVRSATSFDISRLISKMADVPYLANGAVINFNVNGDIVRGRFYHNPPGKSIIEAGLYGTRNVELDMDETKRVDFVVSGHLHQSAIATESYGDSKKLILVSSGTTKGSTPNGVRDQFGERIAAGLTDPVGQSIFIKPVINEKTAAYPVISMQDGALVAAALRFINATESQGITDEVWVEILNRVSPPKVTLRTKNSRHLLSGSADEKAVLEARERLMERALEEDPEAELPVDIQQKLAPIYTWLEYYMASPDNIPLILNFWGNPRYGGIHNGEEKFSEAIDTIKGNPFSFVLLMREIIKGDLAKERDRFSVLNRVIRDLRKLDGQALGLMFDRALKHGSWKHRKGPELEAEWMPLAAGTHLSANTGIPLLAHKGTLNLQIGSAQQAHNQPTYPMVALDRLGNHSFAYRPTAGVLRNYQKGLNRKPILTVGGHVPESAASQIHHWGNAYTENPAFIAPGSFAPVTEYSGDDQPTSPPGQGIILFPGSNPEERKFLVVNDESLLGQLGMAIQMMAALSPEEQQKILG